MGTTDEVEIGTGVEETWHRGLPRREVLFVENYCSNPKCFLNATEAYRLTFATEGGRVKSCETSGCRMLHRPRVWEAVRKCLAERQRKEDEVTTYRVLDIIKTIATTSPAELLDDSGRLRPLSELGEKAVCVADVMPTEGGGRAVLAKREKFIELYMRYANLVRPEVRVDVTLPVVEVSPKKGRDEWNAEQEQG